MLDAQLWNEMLLSAKELQGVLMNASCPDQFVQILPFNSTKSQDLLEDFKYFKLAQKPKLCPWAQLLMVYCL